MALTVSIKDVGTGDGSTKLYTYTGLSEEDVTPPVIESPEWGDRSIQVAGTFNGGTVSFQGSNDGITWATLNDPQGNALTFTASRIEQLLEIALYMRAVVTAGTGLNINVNVLMRRTSGMRT